MPGDIQLRGGKSNTEEETICQTHAPRTARPPPEKNLVLVAETIRPRENKEPVARRVQDAQKLLQKAPPRKLLKN
ncbi:MAG: hypothetical protein GVY36_18980 [Verrucomicrobia bacterium]|nr:hypothetical protein [Verrucomicrobiota bacterium]